MLARPRIAIATALSDPTIFNFHNLFQLTAVLAAQAHPLFVLLWRFLSGRPDNLQHAYRIRHVTATQVERWVSAPRVPGKLPSTPLIRLRSSLPLKAHFYTYVLDFLCSPTFACARSALVTLGALFAF
ncbi:hypothetical protein EDB89DRAFT_2075098 [Lactarius sanguifluus]|nr:hypothetical protein EDB89DRAFT_2075098 [Lactarius sanguifluus]